MTWASGRSRLGGRAWRAARFQPPWSCRRQPQAKPTGCKGGDLPLHSASAWDPGAECRRQAGWDLLSLLQPERDQRPLHTQGVPKGAKASGLPAWGDSFENQPDAALSCPLNPAIPKALTSPARMRQLPEPFPPNEKTRAKSSPTAGSLHSKARGGLCQRSASLLPPIFRTLPGSAFLQGVADPLPTLAADQTGDRYECARPPARHVEPVTATADGYQCSPWAKAVFSKCFPDTVVINSHRN